MFKYNLEFNKNILHDFFFRSFSNTWLKINCFIVFVALDEDKPFEEREDVSADFQIDIQEKPTQGLCKITKNCVTQ